MVIKIKYAKLLVYCSIWISVIFNREKVRSAKIKISIDDTKYLHKTDTRSPSVALAVSDLEYGWSKFYNNTKFLTLAKALGPSYVRFGGTKADRIIFNPSPTAQKVKAEFQLSCTTKNHSNEVFKKQQIHAETKRKIFRERKIQYGIKEALPEAIHLNENQWIALNQFALCANWSLLYTLNAISNRNGVDNKWNSSNTEKLLQFTRDLFQVDWQLGNEPSSYFKRFGAKITPEEHAVDFIDLKKLLQQDEYWNTSMISGPDLGKGKRPGIYMNRFLQKMKEEPAIDHVSIHHYYKNVKDVHLSDLEDKELYDSLEVFLTDTNKLIEDNGLDLPVWLTETSSISGGGAGGISNTFANGFFWLDKLGVASKVGVQNVIRQTFLGSFYGLLNYDFEPRPDYWLTWMYKKLVGDRVLHLNCSKCSRKRFLRVYAGCVNYERSHYDQGDIVTFFVNPLRNKHRLLFTNGNYSSTDLYLFEPYPIGNITSSEIQLNKQVLRLQENLEIPTIKPIEISSEVLRRGVRIPELSYGFIVLKNVTAEACLKENRNT